MKKTNVDEQGVITSFSAKSFYGSKLKGRARVDRRRFVKEDGSKRSQGKFPTDFIPRILGPTICWKVFYRQNDAFEFAQNIAEDVHVFSFESCNDPTKPSTGQRRYLASSLPVFWHYYSQLQPCQRQHYEIIPENSPCKLYFDLEFPTDNNPDRNGNEMVDILIKYVCAWLGRVFGVNCDRKDVLDLDASTPNKCSRHLIFQKAELVFENNVTQGDFVRHIFGVLQDWIWNTHVNKNKGRSSSSTSISSYLLDASPQHISSQCTYTIDDTNASKHSVNNTCDHMVNKSTMQNQYDDDHDLQHTDTGTISDIAQHDGFKFDTNSDHNVDISVSTVDNCHQNGIYHSTLKQSGNNLQEVKSEYHETEDSVTTPPTSVNHSKNKNFPISRTDKLCDCISPNDSVDITQDICDRNDNVTTCVCLSHDASQYPYIQQQKELHRDSDCSSQLQTFNTSPHSFNHLKNNTVDISQENKLTRKHLKINYKDDNKNIPASDYHQTKSPSFIKQRTPSENLIREDDRYNDKSVNKLKTTATISKSFKTIDTEEEDNDNELLYDSLVTTGKPSNILTGSSPSKPPPSKEESSDIERLEKSKNIEDTAFLQDNFCVKELASLVVNKKDGTETLYCDMGVYTKNRNFRLYQSSKLNKNNHLKVAHRNQFFTKSMRHDFNQANVDEEIFYASLISNVCLSPGVCLLRFDSASRSGKVSFPGTKHTERTTSQDVGGFLFHEDKATLEGWGCTSPYPEIDGYISSLLSGSDGRRGSIRHWNYWTSRQTLVYDIVGYRWCHNIQRHHRSNNIMYVVDVGSGVFYQKCHDPECQAVNYKSPEMELPCHVLPGYFLDSDDFQEESCQEPCKAEKNSSLHSVWDQLKTQDDRSEEETLLMAVEDVEMLQSVGDLGL